MSFEGITVVDIVTWLRRRAAENEKALGDQHTIVEQDRNLADLIEKAVKDEAQPLERIVRDAIIGYQEEFPHAPNDDCERELKERAAIANAWLVAHGFEEEPTIWSKEGK